MEDKDKYLQCSKCKRKTRYIRGWSFLPNNICKDRDVESYSVKNRYQFMLEHNWEVVEK